VSTYLGYQLGNQFLQLIAAAQLEFPLKTKDQS
jgi:hypothetical protein